MNRRYLHLIVLVVCTVSAFSSCSNKKVDTSLTIHAYEAMGMPDPEKAWTIEDYTRAYNVLSKLKWKIPTRLPFKESAKSGGLFKRMVSLDYLSFMEDTSLTFSEKAQRITEFGKVYDYWMNIYTAPTVNGKCNTEIAEIRLFNLKVTEAAFGLGRKIYQSDAPENIALRYGYPSVKRAYLSCLTNYLQPRINAIEFSEYDMKRMVDSVHQSIERNKQWLDSTEIIKIKNVLNSVKDSTSSHQLRDEYMRLANSLSS